MIWRLGVAGSPIEHSLSPQLHEAGLRIAGLEGTSTRLELGQDKAPLLRGLLGETYDALSITMPLKSVAATLCDDLDAVASRLGVVNSLLSRDGKILGANTDGLGFVESLRDGFGVTPLAMNVLVLGTGGAALSIIDALVDAGAASVQVLSRTEGNVDALGSRFAGVSAFTGETGEIDLIVNTTPARDRPEPVILAGVGEATIAVDISYEPRMSKWRVRHEEVGCASANGLAMLAYQAALQMKWWWDLDIDAKVLLEVIE